MKRVVVLFLIACGAPPPPLPVPTLEPGAYVLDIVVTRTEGDCEWIGKVGDLYSTSGSIDAQGQVPSPLPGFDCVATYDPGRVTLACKGFGAALSARGAVSADLRRVEGDGVLSHAYGCSSLGFTFSARHK